MAQTNITTFGTSNSKQVSNDAHGSAIKKGKHIFAAYNTQSDGFVKPQLVADQKVKRDYLRP